MLNNASEKSECENIDALWCSFKNFSFLDWNEKLEQNFKFLIIIGNECQL